MPRSLTREEARVNRRCAELLEGLQTSGFPCAGTLPHKAHAACDHVRYGSKLERHAKAVLKKFTQACPATGLGKARRKRRRSR